MAFSYDTWAASWGSSWANSWGVQGEPGFDSDAKECPDRRRIYPQTGVRRAAVDMAGSLREARPTAVKPL